MIQKISILALFALISCAKNNTTQYSKMLKDSQTDRNISQFVKKTKNKNNPNLDVIDYNLVFSKNSFEKLILLSTSLIESTPAVTGNAMADKIVYFKQQHGYVYMFEYLTGKQVSDSIKTEKLISKFKIVSSDDDNVTIDFKAGMNELFMTSSTFSSDFAKDLNVQENIANVTKSYIRNIKKRGKYVLIDEVARVISGKENVSIEIKYNLSFYHYNKNFKAKKSSLQKRVGYFEANPVANAKSSTQDVFISKFDISKPIVYYISRNIPKEYIQAVMDGVKYWNTVFGKEVIKVEHLPENFDVHDPGINVVRWLNWDTAGYAYADLQVDPLTGQTLQTQVFLTSAFSANSFKKTQKVLSRAIGKSFDATAQTEGITKSTNADIYIKGFVKRERCHFSINDSLRDFNLLQDTIKKITNNENNNIKVDDLLLRVSQDYVRAVVAHEVGHTLGLRHNFAGSVYSNLSKQSRSLVLNNYLMTGELVKGAFVSSTVMDYLPFTFSILNGAMIRQKQASLEYDKKAIAWGYDLQKDIKLASFPPFCTDSDKIKKTYVDCKVWDTMNNSVVSSSYNLTNAIENVGIDLAYLLSSAKDLPEDTAINILKYMTVDSDKKAKGIVNYYYDAILDSVKKDANYIMIRSRFPDDIDYYSLADYKKEQKIYQSKSVALEDGLNNLILSKLSIIDGHTKARIIAEQYFDKNLEYLLKEQDVSEKLLNAITEYKKKYFDLFDETFLFNAMRSLESFKTEVKDDLIVSNIQEITKHVVFDKDIDNKNVFSYSVKDLNIRTQATKLMIANLYPTHFSYKRSMQKFQKKMYDQYVANKSILMDNKTIDEVSDELFDTLMQEQETLRPLVQLFENI